MLLKNKQISFFIFSLISIILFIFTIYVEMVAINNILPTLSFLLVFIMLFSLFFLNNNDLLSPLSLFSIMYLGYPIGGYYYSLSTNSYGKFVDSLSLPTARVVEFLEYALMYSIICYIFFVLGYLSIRKNNIFQRNSISKFWIFFTKYYMYFVVILLSIGLYHWYSVAQSTAGGLLEMIIFFQAFPHMAKEANISTLPYHFYYAGIYIWLLGIVYLKEKISIYFVLFSLLGVVINLTQGRITLSITFFLSQLFFIALLFSEKRTKIIYLSISLMLSAFLIYLLRIVSNYEYIGKVFNFSELNVLDIIIGSGNVADLQQLVIIFFTFDINNSLYGLSYFDWIRNTFGSLLGIEPSSVGLTIKKLYIDKNSGAPTPGAIGEAYANFNLMGIFVIYLVGLIFAFLYKKAKEFGSLFLLLLYSIFLARFVFIYAKVDSTMMSNVFWGTIPLALVIFFMFAIYSVSKIKNRNN